MGIGRREFIRLTTLALSGLTINPLNAIAINDNAYVNKKLGILFFKPQDWGFIAVKDFGKLKSEQVIGHGIDKKTDEIWNELSDPICIITKYYQDNPKERGVFSPTITLNITPKSELEDLGYETFEELIAMSYFGITKILKDFRVIKVHEPFLISGIKFYEFDAEYLFEHIDIKNTLKVELKVLKVEHNGYYYDFNFHQSKAQNQTAELEFDRFKESIKLI